jgi:hypothetical protein
VPPRRLQRAPPLFADGFGTVYTPASFGSQTRSVSAKVRVCAAPAFAPMTARNAVLHLQILNMNMKRSTLLLFAAALSAALIYPALARQGTKMAPDAKSTTIEGAVRDLACPVQNPDGSATSFSLKCTLDCVRHGSPIIILTKTGLIYFPISADMPDSSQREKMMPFVGKYVQATGAVFERNGTRAIAITQIKELKSVHIDTDAR